MPTYIESHSVLNTIAAAGADLTVLSTGGYLNVANTDAAAPWVNIPFLGISRKYPPVPLGYLHATPAVKTVTYTAAPLTEYTFIIYSNNKSYRISYTSDATGADATIATNLSAQINYYPDLNVTVSGAASPLTLTGDAGYEIFSANNITGTTIAAAMGTTALDAGASASNTTPVVITAAAAHSFVVGDTVTLSGIATATALNGQTYRISVINSATDFTLEDSVAAGAGTGGTATIVAQAGRGSYANLSSSAPGLVPPYATQSTPLAGTVSTGNYGQFVFNFAEEATDDNGQARKMNYKHTFYYNESDTDYVALRRKMMDFLEGGVAGTPTTANPALTAAS